VKIVNFFSSVLPDPLPTQLSWWSARLVIEMLQNLGSTHDVVARRVS